MKKLVTVIMLFAVLGMFTEAICSEKGVDEKSLAAIEKLKKQKVTPEKDFDYYELDNGTIKITAYNGNAKEIIIPSAIKGKTVSFIDLSDSSDEWKEEIVTGIVIPEGVVCISGFSDMEVLQTVALPSSLRIIDDECFYDCYELINIVFPENLLIIGNFGVCGTNIKSLSLPPSLRFIGHRAFSGNQNLEEIYISDNHNIYGFYDMNKFDQDALSFDNYIYGDKIKDSPILKRKFKALDTNSIKTLKEIINKYKPEY